MRVERVSVSIHARLVTHAQPVSRPDASCDMLTLLAARAFRTL